MTPNAGEYIVALIRWCGNKNGSDILKASLATSYKVKYTWPSPPICKYLPKRNENRCLIKEYFGSFIYSHQTSKTTQISINLWMDKLWCIHTVDYYSAIKKGIPTTPYRILKGIMLSERNQIQMATNYYSFYMKFWKR